MSGIIYLASYPKSGNTWFRVFLTNLRGEKDGPAQINRLDSTPIASARGTFDADPVGIGFTFHRAGRALSGRDAWC